MIRHDSEGSASHVVVKLLHRIHYCEEFTVRGPQLAFRLAACSACIRDHVVLPIAMQLFQHCPQSSVGVVSVDGERAMGVWVGKDGRRGKDSFQLLESFLTLRCPLPLLVFRKQLRQGTGYVTVPMYKVTIIARKP